MEEKSSKENKMSEEEKKKGETSLKANSKVISPAKEIHSKIM